MPEVANKNEIEREDIWFDSSDGSTRLHGVIWWPKGMGPVAAEDHPWDSAEKPKAVIQIVHGMAEHILRYDDFARFLASQGYVVCGHDHINHGQSSTPDRWGKLPLKTGSETLINDVGRLRRFVRDKLPEGTPCFLFGHSMGSFIVRCYISRRGKDFKGAIICGTGQIPAATSSMGLLACKIIAFLRGEDTISVAIDNMGVGAYTKAIEDAKTSVDWLSFNHANVDAYLADEACGFPFSVGGYGSLMMLTREACEESCGLETPPDLPLLFIAGEDDPVGNRGEGVRAAAQMARDSGSEDVTVHIYRDMRHEILNENDRQMVYDDVLSWIEKYLP